MTKIVVRLTTLAVAGVLSACSNTPLTKSESAVTAPAATASEAPKAANVGDVARAPSAAAPAASVLPPYLDPKSRLSTDRSVYFAFDRFDIVGQDGAQTISRQGNYLASTPMVHVRIEGNCDERGGSEYNLALGQRRADAVAGRLRNLGARATQLETVSYGKEKPRAKGHDEAAWSQNRRADIVYAAR